MSLQQPRETKGNRVRQEGTHDELAGAPSTVGVGELEGPEEVGGSLEVGAGSGDLVNEADESE